MSVSTEEEVESIVQATIDAIEEGNNMVLQTMASDENNQVSQSKDSDSGCGRTVFPKVFKRVTENGIKKMTHPFLDVVCAGDIALSNLLTVEKPFLASYGDVGKTWDEFVERLNKQVDDDGHLIFDNIKVQFVRDRFEDYMKFTKSDYNKVPFNSGCDDEDPPSKFINLLEDMYDQKKDFDHLQALEKQARKKNKDRMAKDKVDAESLRRVSLNNFENSKKQQDENVVHLTESEGEMFIPATSRKSTAKVGLVSRTKDRVNTMNTVSSIGDQYKHHLVQKNDQEKTKQMKYAYAQELLEVKKIKHIDRKEWKKMQFEQSVKDKEKEKEEAKKEKEAERDAQRLQQQMFFDQQTKLINAVLGNKNNGEKNNGENK